MFSMFAALPKDEDRPPTADEMENMKQRWRDMNLPDVRI